MHNKMTSHKFLFIVVISLTNYVAGGPIFTPCKIGDDACAVKSANEAFPKFVAGIPQLGIESSDPLHLDFIDGNLSILKYTLTDTYVEGFKDCTFENFNVDAEKMKLHLVLNCPGFKIYGNYVMGGRLIVLPVEGNGTFNINCKEYKITVDSDLKKITGKDDKEHLNIKNFKLTLDALGGVVYDFKNLFNGQKDLSDAVHKFANENWKEVVEFVQEPVFNADFKSLVSRANKYLKNVPYEDLFVQ